LEPIGREEVVGGVRNHVLHLVVTASKACSFAEVAADAARQRYWERAGVNGDGLERCGEVERVVALL
jgi:hypothetical protein